MYGSAVGAVLTINAGVEIAALRESRRFTVAANEVLASRVRAALGRDLSFTEKKMFGGLAFLVQGKMCVSVGRDRCMFRIGAAVHEAAIKRGGCRTVVMRGREYKGYVHVDAAALSTDRELNYWMDLALEYNSEPSASTALSTKRKRMPDIG